MTASITAAQELTFTSTNDGASQNDHPDRHHDTGIRRPSTCCGTTAATRPTDAVRDVRSRCGPIIQQIPPTQDSSFNGVNLLNGDTLKLVFNETGKSTSTIQA